MELSQEQQEAFDKYIEGHNIFITGPGGSGKSALIRLIYAHACAHEKHIQVTAMTGCAAFLLNCKAKTLHSWAGIGLGNGTTETLITRIKSKQFWKKAWTDVDVLIVDEVSMLSMKLFETLNAIGKAVRKNRQPFGGIQLVFLGDFYQLPPVGDKDDADTRRFCFESAEWNSVFARDCQIQLIKIFRQTDDTYAAILNQIREGKIKKSSNNLLMQYVGRATDPSLVSEPTKLFPTRNKVEAINCTQMALLPGEAKEFHVKYLSDMEISNREKLMKRQRFSEKDIATEMDFLAGKLICDKELTLKIGAQVMCIVNMPPSSSGALDICNGSQGIIVSFCSLTGNPRVKFNSGLERTMMRHVWESEHIPGVGVAQVPLILSWAVTIHKSQGATLDAAEIDAGSGIFECGQTYVALSRVKSLQGLYLTSFDASRIRIHRKVKEYYDELNLSVKNINVSPDATAAATATDVTSVMTAEEVVSVEVCEEEEEDCKNVCFDKYAYGGDDSLRVIVTKRP